MNPISRLRNLSFRIYLKIGHMTHVRHWRGHGIHSPFMYALVRHVFMKHTLQQDSSNIYFQMRRHSIGPRDAMRVQNLYSYMHYSSVTVIDRAPERTHAFRHHSGGLYVITDPAFEPYVSTLEADISEGINTLVLAGARRSRRHNAACHSLRHELRCISVDKGNMMYYFFDHRLQPQHYKL